MTSRSKPQGRSASRTLEDGTLHVLWLKPGQAVPPGYKARSAARCTYTRTEVAVLASYVSPSGKSMAQRERKRLKQQRKRRNRAARKRSMTSAV